MMRFAAWLIACALAASPAVAQTTWDTGAKGTNVLLGTYPEFTTTNLYAYKTSTTAAFDSVLGTTSKATGKFYLEYTQLAPASGNSVIIGFCSGSQVLSSAYPGITAANGFGLQNQGTQYSTGGTSGWSAPTQTTATVTGIAIDIDNKKFWVRSNIHGTSNSWANGDPAAGTGGGTYTITGAVFPCVGLFGVSLALTDGGNAPFGSQVFIRAGAPFRDAAPSGFSAWGSSLSQATARGGTFDPTVRSASGVVLSNGNLTAVAAVVAFGVTLTAHGTESVGNGNDVYWEITVGTIGGVGGTIPHVGISAPLTYIRSNSGFPMANITWGSDGTLVVNSTSTGSALPTFTTGDILRFAMSSSAGKIWMAKGCAGAWQLGSTPNPATHTGGQDTSTVTGFMGGADPVVALASLTAVTGTFSPPYACLNPFGGGSSGLNSITP